MQIAFIHKTREIMLVCTGNFPPYCHLVVTSTYFGRQAKRPYIFVLKKQQEQQQKRPPLTRQIFHVSGIGDRINGVPL